MKSDTFVAMKLQCMRETIFKIFLKKLLYRTTKVIVKHLVGMCRIGFLAKQMQRTGHIHRIWRLEKFGDKSNENNAQVCDRTLSKKIIFTICWNVA